MDSFSLASLDFLSRIGAVAVGHRVGADHTPHQRPGEVEPDTTPKDFNDGVSGGREGWQGGIGEVERRSVKMATPDLERPLAISIDHHRVTTMRHNEAIIDCQVSVE